MNTIDKKTIKYTFDYLAKKHDKKYKYKRTVSLGKRTGMIEAKNNSTHIFNTFFSFKLLYHNTLNNISIYTFNVDDIKNTIKYNLNN